MEKKWSCVCENPPHSCTLSTPLFLVTDPYQYSNCYRVRQITKWECCVLHIWAKSYPSQPHPSYPIMPLPPLPLIPVQVCTGAELSLKCQTPNWREIKGLRFAVEFILGKRQSSFTYMNCIWNQRNAFYGCRQQTFGLVSASDIWFYNTLW